MLITQAEFNDLLAGFQRTAFRLEAQEGYAMPYEEASFQRFLAGKPEPPTEVDWWRPWLAQVTRLTSEGKQVARVRVLHDPPSDYQRWEVWATPWHAQAGEDIRYLSRAGAGHLGLPLDHDWWLLDDEQVIIIRYTPEKAIEGKELISDPGTIGRYRTWRDLAVHNATSADDIAAAN
jgi:hypothetical protein